MLYYISQDCDTVIFSVELGDYCMDIEKLIGETTEYDKKQAVEKKKIKNWCKSVSAFANTIGGSLIFGISDNDEIVGVEDIKGDSEFVSQKIKERISPIPAFNLRFEVIDKKKLIIVDVVAGRDTPYYYVGDGVTEAYIRVGNESVAANAAELRRLVLRGVNETYDSQSSGYQIADYAFTKLRERYKKVTGKSFEDKDFESFELVDANGILTNAGALLADECPIKYSRVFCVRWNGVNKSNGKGEAYDSAEYSGSLISLLNESAAFVRRNMRMAWRKLPDSRENMPDYMERNGSGIGKIIDSCEFAVNYTDKKAPIFYSDRSQFRVTLPNLNYVVHEKQDTNDFQSSAFKASKLTKNALEKALENQVMELMEEKPSVTQLEIAQHLELSRTKVQSVIRELLKSGKVERIGGKRYGKWNVKV